MLQLRKIIDNRKICSRIKFMLQDLMELRKASVRIQQQVLSTTAGVMLLLLSEHLLYHTSLKNFVQYFIFVFCLLFDSAYIQIIDTLLFS